MIKLRTACTGQSHLRDDRLQVFFQWFFPLTSVSAIICIIQFRKIEGPPFPQRSTNDGIDHYNEGIEVEVPNWNAQQCRNDQEDQAKHQRSRNVCTPEAFEGVSESLVSKVGGTKIITEAVAHTHMLHGTYIASKSVVKNHQCTLGVFIGSGNRAPPHSPCHSERAVHAHDERDKERERIHERVLRELWQTTRPVYFYLMGGEDVNVMHRVHLRFKV